MWKVLMAIGVVVLITGNAVQAQSRDGFWVGFGAGTGSLQVGGDPRQWGAVGYLKLGGTINQRVLLGAELNGWKRESSAADRHVNLTVTAYSYPSATSGFFWKAGLGWSWLGDARGTGINGVGVVLGLGYDARIEDNFSITPFLNLSTTPFLTFDGAWGFAGNGINMIQFGVGVSWH